VLVLGDFYTTDRPPAAADRAAPRAEPAPARETPAEPALTARAASN
jgi:hypothetical protein